MRLIITEKPSVAKTIAQALGKYQYKEDYYQVGDWKVTWAYGHLLTLKMPEEYDEKYKFWRLEDLPIVPKKFEYKPISKDHKKRLDAIKKLWKEADTVYCATDAGREGELIFRLIQQHVGIKKYFDERNDIELIQILLKQKVFPIKDSYVAFLKRDKNAVYKNPKIVSRLARMLYSMGLDEIYAKISLPKETNRQIEPLFTNWINSGALGCKITRNHSEMLSSTENIVLNSNDKDRSIFAKEHLGYIHAKGLDFVGKFNNKYIIGEAKFLTDYDGHQNAQFNDAVAILSTSSKAIPIAILDGVVYLRNNSKMFRAITSKYSNYNILSALLLKEFLYSLQ